MYSVIWHVSEFVFHVTTFVSIVQSLYYRNILYLREGGRGVDYPLHMYPRLTIFRATPPRYPCVFIKCHREHLTYTVPWISKPFYLILVLLISHISCPLENLPSLAGRVQCWDIHRNPLGRLIGSALVCLSLSFAIMGLVGHAKV